MKPGRRGMHRKTDADLVAEARDGAMPAFEEIVNRHRAAVLAVAAGRLGSLDEAEDVAQEAFVQAYLRLHQLRNPEALVPWLRRLTDRLALMRLRSRREEPVEPGRLETMKAEERPQEGEPGGVGREAELLAQLPPAMRQTLTLTCLAGYTCAEAAVMLGVQEGTVKSRLSRARARLKEAFHMAERELAAGRPGDEFTREVMKRIAHWEKFAGSDEEKARMVESDPEWRRLLEVEMRLEPISTAATMIRQAIASMEPCHEHYLENVGAVLDMIGSLSPGRVLDCNEACEARRQEAGAYARALRAWQDMAAPPRDAEEPTREVWSSLGEHSDEKRSLVGHLIAKLENQSYQVYADEEEDFDRVESRIQHLEICNYNWRANLRIVLQEIGAGRRLFDWHTPDGYNAHGDCPDRVPELRDTMAAVVAWVEGRAAQAGDRANALGTRNPEKCWLAACLCKHVSAQHEAHGGGRLLARPKL